MYVYGPLLLFLLLLENLRSQVVNQIFVNPNLEDRIPDGIATSVLKFNFVETEQLNYLWVESGLPWHIRYLQRHLKHVSLCLKTHEGSSRGVTHNCTYRT